MAHLIDKNLVINNQVNENGIIYRNVRNSPFEIYGLYKPQRQEPFSRMSEEVAKQVGKSRSAITNALRLLDLPEDVLEMLRSGELSAGHARALLGLKNRENIVPLAMRIINKDLSVRDTEAAVKKLNVEKEEDFTELDSTEGQIKLYMKELENRSRSLLGRNVKITHTNKKKTIEIYYETNDDLESLLKTLCGDNFFDNI